MDDKKEEIVPQEPQEQQEEQQIEEPEKKDRTAEQFDKLKEHNSELKEAKEKAEAERDEYKNLFESLRPQDVPQQTQQQYDQPINQAPNKDNFQNLSQGDINKVFQGMVDENGYLDGNKLMQTLSTLDQRATQAEQRAKAVEEKQKKDDQERREKEEKQATTQIYEKYPQLNPEGDNFDDKFWGYVYNELAMKSKQGQMPSHTDYMEAADKVYKDFYEGRDNVTKEEKEKAQQIEDQKRTINATKPRSSMMKGYYEQESQEALIKAVRAGKKGALAEALRRKENPQQ